MSGRTLFIVSGPAELPVLLLTFSISHTTPRNLQNCCRTSRKANLFMCSCLQRRHSNLGRCLAQATGMVSTVPVQPLRFQSEDFEGTRSYSLRRFRDPTLKTCVVKGFCPHRATMTSSPDSATAASGVSFSWQCDAINIAVVSQPPKCIR
jgi:hypothetical protein